MADDHQPRQFSGHLLRRLRQESDFTAPQLADAAGLGLSGLMHIESGKRKPSVNRLPLLADALGCQIDDLFVSPE
jgi:transcriptional regulator with XRE-family HTH domain